MLSALCSPLFALCSICVSSEGDIVVGEFLFLGEEFGQAGGASHPLVVVGGDVLEVGRVALTGTSGELRDDESVRRSYLGY